MTLITCRECQTVFSNLAERCPKCGAPTAYSIQPELPVAHESYFEEAIKTTQEIRYTSTLLFLGIVFFPIVFYWFLFRKGHTTFARVVGGIWLIVTLALFCSIFYVVNSMHNTGMQDPNNLGEPEITVEAKQYFSDYQSNELAADQKYKNKVILIQGVIADVSKNLTNDAYVSLNTENMLMWVHAKLQSSEIQNASHLNKGDTVVLKCVGNSMLMDTPTLKQCIILTVADPDQENIEAQPQITQEQPNNTTVEIKQNSITAAPIVPEVNENEQDEESNQIDTDIDSTPDHSNTQEKITH